jgi:hypothetical protein
MERGEVRGMLDMRVTELVTVGESVSVDPFLPADPRELDGYPLPYLPPARPAEGYGSAGRDHSQRERVIASLIARP